MNETIQEADSDRNLSEASNTKTPAILDILEYFTVGFNTTTRYLEALAHRSILEDPRSTVLGGTCPAHPARATTTTKPLVAVFVPRSDQPSILHSHLPLLTKTASLASPLSPEIRLVTLPKGAEIKLSAALGIPRVGLIGLMDNVPISCPLSEYVRDKVPLVEASWLHPKTASLYLPVKINATHTPAPLGKHKRDGKMKGIRIPNNNKQTMKRNG